MYSGSVIPTLLCLASTPQTLSHEAPLRKVVFAANMAGPFREGDELVQYWMVEKALPNGKPDLRAPSNSWREVRTTFTRIADSQKDEARSDGTKLAYVPRYALKSHAEFGESAPASSKLDDLFTVVRPTPAVGTTTMSSAGHVQTVQKGYRLIVFRGEMFMFTHEIRSLGTERVHRWQREKNWSLLSTIVTESQDYDPFTGKEFIPRPSAR